MKSENGELFLVLGKEYLTCVQYLRWNLQKPLHTASLIFIFARTVVIVCILLFKKNPPDYPSLLSFNCVFPSFFLRPCLSLEGLQTGTNVFLLIMTCSYQCVCVCKGDRNRECICESAFVTEVVLPGRSLTLCYCEANLS